MNTPQTKEPMTDAERYGCRNVLLNMLMIPVILVIKFEKITNNKTYFIFNIAQLFAHTFNAVVELLY